MLLRANFRDHSNLSTGLASQHLNIAPHQSDFMIFNANGVLFAIKFFLSGSGKQFFYRYKSPQAACRKFDIVSALRII